jgi:hypothetical protein
MTPQDKPAFAELLTDALAFYRQDTSRFALSVWWSACQAFSLEQVGKALTAHAMDPERGRFAPMPSDIVRVLQGTHQDRSLMAWGKVLEAVQRVGAYQSVVFDDAAIHAAIEDMGGWCKVCRSEMSELQFVQRRFCDGYRAYAARPGHAYPPRLIGESETANRTAGKKAQPAMLIGNPELAKAVEAGGSDSPKVGIALDLSSLPQRIGMAA